MGHLCMALAILQWSAGITVGNSLAEKDFGSFEGGGDCWATLPNGAKEMCCDSKYGSRGRAECWDSVFTYARCCISDGSCGAALQHRFSQFAQASSRIHEAWGLFWATLAEGSKQRCYEAGGQHHVAQVLLAAKELVSVSACLPIECTSFDEFAWVVERLYEKDVRNGATFHARPVSNHSEPPVANFVVLVPGLGEPQRAAVVQSNIEWLWSQHIRFDCMIYVYKSEIEFPLNASDFAPCELVREPGYWMQHIARFPTSRFQQKWILLWLDAVLPMPDVSLRRFFDIAVENRLDVASLSENPASIHRVWDLMKQNSSNKVGRLTNFTEFNFNLFSYGAFKCLQEKVVNTDLNVHGWGVDLVFPGKCHPRIGIIDEMSVSKLYAGSYNEHGAMSSLSLYMDHEYSVDLPEFKSLGLLKDPELVFNLPCNEALEAHRLRLFEASTQIHEISGFVWTTFPDNGAQRCEETGGEFYSAEVWLSSDLQVPVRACLPCACMSPESSAWAVDQLYRSVKDSCRVRQQLRIAPGQWQHADSSVVVVVPGLGESERVDIVRSNIAWLRSQDVPFNCIIYVYRDEIELPLDPSEFTPCKLIRQPGFWTQHLSAFPVAVYPKSWVLLWLDSAVVMPGARLRRLLDIALANKLDVTSLSENIASVHRIWPLMWQDPGANVGRLTDFCEFNFNLFSRRAFECLQNEIIDVNLNPLGLGMDLVFPRRCDARIGIVDEMSVSKLYGGSYNITEALAQQDAYINGKFSQAALPSKTVLGLLSSGFF